MTLGLQTRKQPATAAVDRKQQLEEVDFGVVTAEARKYVWSGAVPVQIRLHPSEISATAASSSSSLVLLAPRNGYLPLLEIEIRQYFNKALTPGGSDTIWFDYQGLPLKWHIPTGVLYDLLVAEPERPWNLMVHFKAYPADVLTLCEDESVKWNYINALKEASYVMYGSTKSIMNMSQLDQVELWRCVVAGDLEGYDRIAARLRPAFGGGVHWVRDFLHMHNSEDTQSGGTLNKTGSETGKPGRIPVRVYVRTVDCDLDDLFDAAPVTNWDEVAYTTRPIDVREGSILTVRDVLMKAAPQLFSPVESTQETSLGQKEGTRTLSIDEATAGPEIDGASNDKVGGSDAHVSQHVPDTHKSTNPSVEDINSAGGELEDPSFEGIVRIQGIEPSLDLPLEWVARNLCGPEHFIHVIVISTCPTQLPTRVTD